MQNNLHWRFQENFLWHVIPISIKIMLLWCGSPIYRVFSRKLWMVAEAPSCQIGDISLAFCQIFFLKIHVDMWYICKWYKKISKLPAFCLGADHFTHLFFYSMSELRLCRKQIFLATKYYILNQIHALNT